ncbi:hypothetical protein PV371_38100 [Streptomyces sp. TX20-6-3]|uniref:hypothetical protein n=1 Tax=Streptomyces sp. TX20-6-3 TaxID=3028705 RepID=UPI0029A35915|nr:hypothetical protein [Streptomyces sp. TX20-6-3]MDX2565370.1 hypothetical protein [Streptomyces sp. TX20-6-3]
MEKAQKDLTSCLQAAAAGRLPSFSPALEARFADPVGSYRPVIVAADLKRTGTRKDASTWIVGKSPQGQLAVCVLPSVNNSFDGREVWILDKSKPVKPVSAEGDWGTVFPANDHHATALYGSVMIGRSAPGITRVTVQFSGQEERDAQVIDGVWLAHMEYAPPGNDVGENWPAPQPTLRGYHSDGALAYSSSGQ